MAIPHAKPAEAIDVRPLGEQIAGARTTTLIKTDALEVIRLVLPEGKAIERHEVPGDLTVQCLEGRVVLDADPQSVELAAGMLAYLEGATAHAVRAVEPSLLLVTIQLVHKPPK